ncbi:MAG: transcription termination factor NusA [Dehalococcoidia bacterium]
MKSEFLIAVTQLAAERNLPREVVIEAIEAALISVYKKDSMAAGQNLSVKILPTTGEVKVCALKTVVDEVTDTDLELTQKEAEKYKKGAALGDVVEIEAAANMAGRIAAQTAKQVVMQRLKEAERELVYEEFSDREWDLASAVVQRTESRQVVLDIDKTEAVMPGTEMVPTERYRSGQRLKVLIVEVNRSPKGPQVIVSRSHRNLVSRLFELEVPEVYNGTVEIRSIAREPGCRTKVAVSAKQEGVDPVGSCVGLRGIRIQNIVNELHGEKIDVVQWDKDPVLFIANALSPAQVARVEMNEEEQSATVVVPDRHLSLAIGKEGQNARLAAKLSGWRIDIKGAAELEEERLQAGGPAVKVQPRPKAAAPEPVEPAPVETAPQEEAAPAEEAPAVPQEEAVPVAEVITPEEAPPVEEAAPEEPIPEEQPAPVAEATTPEKPAPVKAAAPKQVVSVGAEEAATRSIEEIWPVAEEVVKPATVLRFAEDLDIHRPVRSRSRSKSKKRKTKRPGQAGPASAGVKKARVPVTPVSEEEGS